MNALLDFSDAALPTYEPELAVVFYHCAHARIPESHLPPGLSATLAAVHPLEKTRSGNHTLGPATFLTRADTQKLAALFAGTNPSQPEVALYPEGLLHHDEESVTWFVPAARRPMHFLLEATRRVALSVVWPSLVLHARGERLFVAASPGTGRPAPNTALFHAPLMNVWENTQVCTGDATLPDTTPLESLPGWNAVIFDTAFTHVNHPHVLRTGATTNRRLFSYWKSRARPRTPPPEEDLRPLRQTVSTWLAALPDAGR